MDLQTIKKAVLRCDSCELSRNVPKNMTPVPGVGSYKARFMFITTRPTEDSHLYESPLDLVNQLLISKIIKDSGIYTSDVYITSIVKCYNSCNLSVRKTASLFSICSNLFLEKEISLINPLGILFFGKPVQVELLSRIPKFYQTHSISKINSCGRNVYQETLNTVKEMVKNC